MSAWKSPLLYIGIAVIVAAAAALVAPLFIDWSAYRADIEDYGRKLTGRNVAVTGPIEARLFPWPVLILNGVRVANPEGANVKHLMEAGRVSMSMALPPLFRGRVEVDAVEIDEPVFAFERLPTGVGTWDLKPEQPLGSLFNPDRVAVSGILIRDGTVFLGDDRRGGLAEIKHVSATLSAPALSGPWRMEGLARYRDGPIEINLGIGKVRPGEPVKFGFRVASADGAGMVYSFDGEAGGEGSKAVKGSLKIAPPVLTSGKSDHETRLSRFSLRSQIEADFDRVNLSKIEISPERSFDAGNFITGEAVVTLGSRVSVRTSLSAARLDLDQILGPRGREALQSAAVLETLAGFLSRLPEGLDIDAELAATSMIVGGETLEESRVKATLAPDRMRIDEIAVAMPGQTDVSFSGLFVSGGDEPLLSGDLRIESVSLRDFVVWALPEQQRSIENAWSGIRGKLKLEAKLDTGSRHARLSELHATLDDATFTGGFSLQQGPDPAMSLRLIADRVNVDRYLPRGLGSIAGESDAARALVELLASSMSFGDLQLTAQADRLRIHGVEAEDIAIDIAANENGVELRTAEIGKVGAARLDFTGLLRFPGDEGIQGSIRAAVDAQDPRGLLRLLGLFGPEGQAEPSWAQKLGPLDVRLLGEATTEDSVTTASVALSGKAGDGTARLDGRFRGDVAKWQDGDISVAGEASSATGDLLAALSGIDAGAAFRGPAEVSGSAKGSLNGGLASAVELELFDAKAQFAGTVRQGRLTVEADGRLALLAERSGELVAALGLPQNELSPLASVLSAETALTYDGTGLNLAGLTGTAGGAAFSGDLKVTFDPIRRISGRLATGRLSLPWLLQAALMPRQAQPQDLSSPFATTLPGIEADIAVAVGTLEALPNLAMTSAELKLLIKDWRLSVDARGQGPGDQPLSGKIAVGLDSRGAEVEGAVEGKLAFGEVLKTEDGNRVLEADGFVKLAFSGTGRTPAGLLSSARAEGTYELPGGLLKRVDPQAFARDLATVKQPSDIDQLISVSLRSGDMAFEGGSGTLALANGVLTAKPLPIKADGTSGELRFVFEPATGEVDLSLTLTPSEPKGIPSFDLAYVGNPGALQSSTDTQELKSRLSLSFLKQSIDQLEELQREERRIIEEEEQFRREQQARREAEQELERKVRELAARRKIQEQEQAEEGSRRPEEGQAPAGEQKSDLLDAITVQSLGAPAGADGPPVAATPPTGSAARNAPVAEQAPPAVPQPAPAASPAPAEPSRSNVPRPRSKPDHAPAAEEAAKPSEPFKLPPSGNIGQTLERIFSSSGPTVLQPGLAQSQPRRPAPER